MYSLVLMMALTNGTEAPACHRGCFGGGCFAQSHGCQGGHRLAKCFHRNSCCAPVSCGCCAPVTCGCCAPVVSCCTPVASCCDSAPAGKGKDAGKGKEGDKMPEDVEEPETKEGKKEEIKDTKKENKKK